MCNASNRCISRASEAKLLLTRSSARGGDYLDDSMGVVRLRVARCSPSLLLIQCPRPHAFVWFIQKLHGCKIFPRHPATAVACRPAIWPDLALESGKILVIEGNQKPLPCD